LLCLQCSLRVSRTVQCRCLSLYSLVDLRALHSFPTRRSSDLRGRLRAVGRPLAGGLGGLAARERAAHAVIQEAVGVHVGAVWRRSEEHTSELQSRENIVCRLLLEKKKKLKTECLMRLSINSYR